MDVAWYSAILSVVECIVSCDTDLRFVCLVACVWLKCADVVLCCVCPIPFSEYGSSTLNVIPQVISPRGIWTYGLSLVAQAFSLDWDSPLLSRMFCMPYFLGALYCALIQLFKLLLGSRPPRCSASRPERRFLADGLCLGAGRGLLLVFASPRRGLAVWRI